MPKDKSNKDKFKEKMLKKSEMFEKGKNKLTKEKIMNKEMLKKPETLKNEKKKMSTNKFGEKMLKREVSEKPKNKLSKKVENDMVVAGKTQKNELKEPSWRSPHLNFGPSKLKLSQLKFAKREVSKREVSKREMPLKSKLKEKMPEKEVPKNPEDKFNKNVEKDKQSLNKSQEEHQVIPTENITSTQSLCRLMACLLHRSCCSLFNRLIYN